MKGNLQSAAPKVQEYLDFRRFLSDWFQWKKSHGKYSYQQFAEDCGISSSSFLLLIIQGKRNVSLEVARKIGEGMKLSKASLNYFLDLCSFNQLSSISERAAFGAKVAKVAAGSEQRLMEKDLFSLYSSWHNLVVRELVALPDFVESAEWISLRCRRALSEKDAEQALNFLTEHGFLIRNENGKLQQSQAQLWSGEDIVSVALAKFQRDMILKGAEAIDQFDASEREISSVTVRLSSESAAKVKQKIQELRDEILKLESEDCGPSIDVIQVNFQQFPLTMKV